jgi:hypothetical protein
MPAAALYGGVMKPTPAWSGRVRGSRVDATPPGDLLYRTFGITFQHSIPLAMPASTTTIVILSDPGGGEEALGRMFNGLAVAYELKRRQEPVQVVFQGTGTRWPGLLTTPDHPAHLLYMAVEDTVGGASAGCATIFGARPDLERDGFRLLAANEVPGTDGLPSLAQYASDGPVITF